MARSRGTKTRSQTPAASATSSCRASSAGTNPGTRELPPTLEQQVANVFAAMRGDVEAAGGSVDDIIKVTFWVKDPVTQRAALNAEWVKMFPDAEARPARHTLPLPRRKPSTGSGRLHRRPVLTRRSGHARCGHHRHHRPCLPPGGEAAPADPATQRAIPRLHHRGRLRRPAPLGGDQGQRGQPDQGPQDRPDVTRDAAPGQHHRTGLRRADGGHVLLGRRRDPDVAASSSRDWNARSASSSAAG